LPHSSKFVGRQYTQEMKMGYGWDSICVHLLT